MPRILLEKILREKGISKRRFAKMVGVEYANVFRFFRPGYDPKLSMLKKWADVLEVSIVKLIASDTSGDSD